MVQKSVEDVAIVNHYDPQAHQLHGNASLRSLCQAGLALQRLVIEGSSTGLYGRTVVTFAPGAPSTELASHSIGPGDIVGVRGLEQKQKEEGEERNDPPSGVVTRTSATKVTVAFEAGVEELEAAEQVVLVRENSPIMFCHR